MPTRELQIDEGADERGLTRGAVDVQQTRRLEPAGPWRALAIAVLVCGLGIAAVALFAFDVAKATRLDSEGFEGFLLLGRVTLAGVSAVSIADNAVYSVNPFSVVTLALVLAILVSHRRRPVIMIAIPVVLLGSVLGSAALKSAIGGHSAASFVGASFAGQSFPSDHAAVSMALALCLLLASSREWSGLVAGFGAVYALLVGYASILLGGHRPSDVVGGYLMAGLWAMIAVIGLRLVEARTPPQSAQVSRAPRLTPRVALSSVFAFAVAGALLTVTLGPHQPAPRGFIGSAIGIALVAVALIYVFIRLAADRELPPDPHLG